MSDNQMFANTTVEVAMKHCIESGEPVLVGKLRSCNAKVYENENYYILESYNTVVAIISKKYGTTYDFLRKVYGYTSTSTKHIAKFRADYGTGKTYMWRNA